MSYLSKVVCLVAILIASAVARPAPAAPVIVNGKFSTPGVPPDPFAGWSTDLNLGVPPLFDIGELAVFEVIGRVAGFEFARQLEQTFVLPTNALTLSFDFLFESVDDGSVSDQNDPLDSFQASLFDLDVLDAFGFPTPLFPSAPGFFAFYSIDSPSDYFDPTYVSTAMNLPKLRVGWTRVTLDLSSAPSHTLLLDFSLIGFDDGSRTVAYLDNVKVTLAKQGQVIPEPASWAIWAGMALVGCVGSRRRNAWLPGFTIRRS